LRVWEGDGIARKGVLAAVLTGVNSASGTFTVANTHLQAQYGSERYAEVRAAQVKELDAAIGNVGPGPRDRPIVLAGDFNTRPDDPLYSKIGQQWIDLTAGYRKRCERVAREACGTSFSGQLPSEWIDYVLLRQMDGLTAAAVVELIRNKREDDPFSDHEGLQADISITRSPAAASGLLGRLVHQVGDPRPLTRRNSLDILLGLSERRFPI
jgi:endonuclease/exonuclease/phosphatase family metal-dependent hydrolase